MFLLFFLFKNVYLLPLINREINELNDFEKDLYNFFPQYYGNYLYEKIGMPPKLIIVFISPNKDEYKTKSGIDFSMYEQIQVENYNVEFYLRKNQL